MNSRRGWTLVEAVIAIALMGVLAAIVMPYLIGKLRQARTIRVMSDLRAIEVDLESFQAEHGSLPDDLTGVGREGKLDPWGYGYRYYPFKGSNWKNLARKDRFLVPINSTYDLYSIGPDGATKTPLQHELSWDDIIRANNGEYLGRASDF